MHKYKKALEKVTLLSNKRRVLLFLARTYTPTTTKSCACADFGVKLTFKVSCALRISNHGAHLSKLISVVYYYYDRRL